ncbi:Small-conductance mechanosensitive channel [Janthinobacterium psychrotolerans]|uniref:Small-conductance mechanosensitive channel n=1 Tax=Janthinobacterium psychrotolerans TaxID=1747903 RepID=A0A1A7C1N6_9BURK|nr:Small-conductance mechanosensitive channel [Janthinobacterium psychrotolerans]
MLAVAGILLAFASLEVLGGPFGWLADGREAAGLLAGDGIPLLQLLLLAMLLDQLIWALAARGRTLDMRVPRLALQIVTFLIYALFFCGILNQVFGLSMTAMLGASGVIGLILGFGLRGLVADVFSGIALHLDASISVGDWVDLQYRGRDMSGKVVDFAWRTVVLADRADNLVLIPNGEFAGVMVTNRSRPGPLSKYECLLELDAGHDTARILAILDNALARAVQDGLLSAGSAPYTQLAALKDGLATYRMVYFVEVGARSPGTHSHVALQYGAQFLRAAGVPLASSQQVEWRRQDGPERHHLARPEARAGVLAGARYLSALSPQELAVIAAETVTVRTGPGQALLNAGDPGETMFVVLEGSFEVVIDGPHGPLEVARLWPGDCFGEMSLFTGAPRSAHVRARTASVTLEVAKHTMAGIFERNPKLVERIAALIEQRRSVNEDALLRPAGLPAGAPQSPGMLERIREFFRLARS